MSTITRSAPVLAPAPLPVELTKFTGAVDVSSKALLQWITATERNSAHFGVERSADGTNFIEVGRLSAAGISTQQLNYQWLDAHPLTQPYYRLRQVDLDGATKYTEVITLMPRIRVAQQIEVYPNPSAGQTVQMLLQGFEGENLTLRLADVLGRPVITQILTPAESHYLAPLPHGLAGTYFLTFTGINSPIQKRIVVSD